MFKKVISKRILTIFSSKEIVERSKYEYRKTVDGSVYGNQYKVGSVYGNNLVDKKFRDEGKRSE